MRGKSLSNISRQLTYLRSLWDAEYQKELRQNAYSVSLDSYNGWMERPIMSMLFHYYEKRGLRWPTLDEALQWAHTESGEVTELLLARTSGWVRNNPEKHEDFSETKLMEEIADQVFMLLVAGMVSGYNVLDVMMNKMQRKLAETEEKS